MVTNSVSKLPDIYSCQSSLHDFGPANQCHHLKERQHGFAQTSPVFRVVIFVETVAAEGKVTDHDSQQDQDVCHVRIGAKHRRQNLAHCLDVRHFLEQAQQAHDEDDCREFGGNLKGTYITNDGSGYKGVKHVSGIPEIPISPRRHRNQLEQHFQSKSEQYECDKQAHPDLVLFIQCVRSSQTQPKESADYKQDEELIEFRACETR